MCVFGPHVQVINSPIYFLSNLDINLRKYSCFSLLLSVRYVSLGGMSAPLQHKFHTDEVNQWLHKKCGIHGVLNVNLFDFTFLLVDY